MTMTYSDNTQHTITLCSGKYNNIVSHNNNTGQTSPLEHNKKQNNIVPDKNNNVQSVL